ncbi:hypothetical protein [Nocardioides bruguierae]|uniref:hypothetical protein n=1 Tax=Nocardioides bruguierae TaxID=2945102 RepID=UPI002021962F|nr:hypothetical protein [Nocardioides bruguierae]MCL8024887.1 hypothetical protein [Nocardioides bruguierae]
MSTQRRSASRHLVLRDETPLAGRAIDVRARVGWTARMARLLHGAPQLRVVGGDLGVSASTLHRLETGQLRDGTLLRAYEERFGLAGGSLRGAIGATCRTFPRESQSDRRPTLGPSTVEHVSALTEGLLDALRRSDGGRAAPLAGAGAWLDWAAALARPESLGLPESIALDLLDHLADEMGRAVGPGYPTRYEALSLMRCGPYGHLVVEVARRLVADPDVQVLADLMSAVGEHVDDAGLSWCGTLLHDPRGRVVESAVLSLCNMAIIGDPERVWGHVLAPLLAAFDQAEPGSTAHEWLSHALRSLPPVLVDEARPSVRRRLAPSPPTDFEPGEALRETRAAQCDRAAHRITEGLGLEEQPVLSRLLYDVSTAAHEERAVTSYMLLGVHPEIAGPAAAALLAQAQAEPDPVLQRRTTRRLAGARLGADVPDLSAWLDHPDPRLQGVAVRLRAQTGTSPSAPWARADDLDDLDPALADALVGAWGLAGDAPSRAALGELALTGGTRAGAARWWLARGARVHDGCSTARET